MIGRSVLIVGDGIAGPALAYWLLRHGFEPTIVERSPYPRTEGYVIDFWGLGYDILERMGVLPAVMEAGYEVREVRLLGGNGGRRGGFRADVFRRVTGGRHISLPRGALSQILHRSLGDRIRMRWDDTPVAFEHRAKGVVVHFRSGHSELFNVVVGADGLHSSVRELAFGDTTRFERSLGFRVAAFESAGYGARDEGVYVTYGAPGRQVARFALRDDRTMFLLVVADRATPNARLDPGSIKDYLHVQFGNLGWELPAILAAMESCNELYFDHVSQIRMPRWSRCSVALVGDAAYAPSLLAGQGSALAVIGAYVLAGELSRAVTPEGAFDRYEARLRDFIVAKQDAAVALAGSFAPSSQLKLWLRNVATRAFAIPGIASWALAGSFSDDLQLPEYSRP